MLEWCGLYIYNIWPTYRKYPYKRLVNQFQNLKITARVFLATFLIKAYDVGTHLNWLNNACFYKENQKKNIITWASLNNPLLKSFADFFNVCPY